VSVPERKDPRRSVTERGKESGARPSPAPVPHSRTETPPPKRISRQINFRAMLMILPFLAVAVYLIYVLFQLQIVDHEKYREKVLNQMTYETEVNPERGTIYDRNGNILATNMTVYLVFISPDDIIDAMAERETEAVEALAKWEQLSPEEQKTFVIPQTEFDYTASDGTEYTGLKMNELIARALSDILGVEYEKVLDKAAMDGRKYEVILKNVDEARASLVRAFISKYNFTRQIYLRASSLRYYPYGTLASHAIGFTNSDGIGIYGLEAYYNNLLEGTSGRYIKAQDARQGDMPFDFETFVEAEDGVNVVTTMDMYVQYELENQLEATYYESGAGNRVTGIVMDVKTNGVLAMATYPPFDLNHPYTLDEESQKKLDALDPEDEAYASTRSSLLYAMWKNKATTELYEPGSTFKIITTAMGLEENAVRVNESFTCMGSYRVTGYSQPISCHKVVGHGTMPFYQMLQQSCNPTMMRLAERLGADVFYSYFLSFGYGGSTGIDLPGESYPIISSKKDFGPVSLAVYSFGQTFKVTPIQQLTAISAVANGGYLMTPHLLQQLTDADGNVIQSYESESIRQVVSGETCKTITEILEDGVSGNGGAKNAYVKGYKVAAKTGTSEKRDKYDENGERPYRVGSCVAYAPADDPQVAVVIMVDEPMNGSVYGSVVAAPYVSKLLSFVLPYMGIEAQYTEEELKKVEVSISNYVGFTVEAVETDLSWRGIDYTIVGEGDTVTAQIPAGGSTLFKDSGKLILYTGEETPKNTVTVPDLIGKSAEAANRLLINSGLNIAVTGATNGDTATVIHQSPAAGEKVPAATLVTVDLRHLGLTDD